MPISGGGGGNDDVSIGIVTGAAAAAAAGGAIPVAGADVLAISGMTADAAVVRPLVGTTALRASSTVTSGGWGRVRFTAGRVYPGFMTHRVLHAMCRFSLLSCVLRCCAQNRLLKIVLVSGS
jgi:hypothetical protein